MPDHVRLLPCRRVRVWLANETIVDTARGYVVNEGGLPPRYYVPRDDVRAELISSASGSTCPWKGRWTHLDVIAGNIRVPNGAWTYYETTAVCDPIRDHVAFYPHRMDRVEVE